MTRHANQNAPFSALLSPSEGGRGVTVESGDTILVARGERHIRLNNGIMNYVGPAILNSPNTFIGHDFGQILTLEKGDSHEDTAAATIVHGTSGVYFEDGEDLSLSDTCRWVTIVNTRDGWMEVARDGTNTVIYSEQEIGTVHEPMIRVHPDFPGVLEAYIPATVKTRNGDTVYVKRPDGTSDLKPVKLVFKPGDGMVGTAVDGDGDLVDGTPWETAYPLTAAQSAVCTQDALGTGNSACYSLQINRKTGTFNLVRLLDTPKEEPLIVSNHVDQTSADSLAYPLYHYTLWGINNISSAPIHLTRASAIRYATSAGAAIIAKVRVRAADTTDRYKPSTILWESDDIAVTPTAGNTSYSVLPDIQMGVDAPVGTTTWVTLERISGTGTLYITRGAHNTNNITIAPQLAPRYLYGYFRGTSSTDPTIGDWDMLGNPASSFLLHGELYGYYKGHPRALLSDPDGDHSTIALIGQGSKPADLSSIFASDSIDSVWRGMYTGSSTPIALVPTTERLLPDYKVSDISPLSRYYAGDLEYVPLGCLGAGLFTDAPAYYKTGDTTNSPNFSYIEPPMRAGQRVWLRNLRSSHTTFSLKAAGNIILAAMTYSVTKTIIVGSAVLLVGRDDGRWELVGLDG